MRSRILGFVLAVLASVACSTRPPHPQPPTPPTPSPVCEAGQTTCCWHMPPGNQWLYACPAPNVEGGVLNVAGGPAQCPENRCAAPPPTCPPGEVLVDGVCQPKPPEPPSGTTPPKGEPQGPEKLLRIGDGPTTYVNGKKFEIVMAVPCCEGWSKVPNQRWPMASEGFMDETKKYGFNAFHFRVGPWFGDANNESEWADIGGAYLPGTMDWNPQFWQKVRDLIWKAYQNGQYVEVIPIDTWYIKHCTWKDAQCPWPQSQIEDAFNGRKSPEQERFLRKTVEETGCFGNVFYGTGNEEDEVPAGGDLYNWYIDVLRDEFKKTGCSFDHVIGTGSSKGVKSDYQITHENAPLTAPHLGKFTLNNEHNPEKEPSEEASRFKTARDAGQSYAAWRAGAKDPKWEERLKLFKDVIGGGSSGGGCFAPDPNDSKWDANPIPPDQRGPMMMKQINEAKAKVGNRCGATAPCTEEPCAPPVHLGCLETNGLVAEELRKMGLCASGPWVDATAVLAPDGKWEEYHICSTGDGCYTGTPYKFAWTYHGTNPTPGPTPPPTGSCSNPPPHAISHFNVKEHTKGPNKTIIDSTPIVHDAAYCASIGFTDGRIDCPVRMEGDPQRVACEAEVVGSPVWVTLPPNGFQSAENPYQAWVPRNNPGTAKVCASKNPAACGQVQVTP